MKRMISCVSLNPSIDRTLGIDRLCAGGLNRVRSQTDAAAGKGVNVSLALAALGKSAMCVGFMWDEGEALFRQRLENGGVAWDFTQCPGAVRVNLKVMDRARGEITELNSPGVPVTQAQLEDVRARIAKRAATSSFLILSGSLPPSCPGDFYQALTTDAAKAGCRVILDADGERLRHGLMAEPYLIKPNRAELEALTGMSLRTTDDVLDAARSCIRMGARNVAVSLGAEGAILTNGIEAWRAKGVPVKVKSTVAAGDSMVAGFAAAFCDGRAFADALRLGTAAATVRCCTPPDEVISGEACRKMAKEIEVERIG